MRKRTYYILRTLIILLGVALFAPAMGQNTRGDRPLDNRPTIRRTEGKTVKKKSKASTRDIAGRRLRTKNKSSANRANVGIPQPYTTSRQPRRETDRAARVPFDKRGNVSRERRRSDPDRSWQGDISGYKSRKIKPSENDANRANVYPQGKYVQKHPQPKARPFKGYENKTASGKPIVKRSPKHSERAWRGDLKGQPFYPPSSRTGRVSNLFPQKTKYSKYVSKSPSPRDRPFNNRENVAKARRMGTDTSPKNWKRGQPIGSYGQAPFVTRGRKNVYWGKSKVGGKAITRDPAGRPLSRRNFRSQGVGFIGTDTLKFFGRKPHEVSVAGQKRKGRFLPGSESKGGWLNDIAGYRLRKHIPGGAEAAGEKGKRYKTSTGFRSNKPIQGKTPGIGATAIERGLKKTGGGSKTFGDAGGAYTGSLKAKSRGKFIGGKRAALWNNNGSPIQAKGALDHGGRYSGNIKRTKPYADEEWAYRGFLKGGKKQGKYIGAVHKLWNNDATPVAGKNLPLSGLKAGRFSGRLRDNGKNFGDQGGGYTGDLKQHKQGKYVGTVHRLWNNNGKATTEILTTKAGAAAGNFQGHSRPKARGKAIIVPNKLWNNNGKAVTEIEATKAGAAAGNFQGRSRPKARGKALIIPNKLWNNNEKPVTEIEATKSGAAAGTFQGRRKTHEPEKSKIMSTPNVLWNNKGKAVTQIETTKTGARAGTYQGRLKAKRPEKYPLNSSNVSWNNDGKATTQIKLTSAGASAGAFSGRTKYHKETKHRDTEIEDRMKLKRDYVQNPHQVEAAIRKQKPELNYKAGNFSSGAKVNGRRMHSPNSVDDAIDSYHNRASARRTDYQGNIRMRKFIDRRESPDAKFVHNGENNVKEDRTIMTNMKLFWAKLFQKSDSQPSNLKDRSNKLKYDKGEKGLWAD